MRNRCRPSLISIRFSCASAQLSRSLQLSSHILTAVRRGTILVFTMGDDALADSLDFQTTMPADGFYTLGRTSVAGGNPQPPTVQDPRAIFQTAFPISVTVASTSKGSSQTFLWLEPRTGSKAAQLDSAQQAALVIGHR